MPSSTEITARRLLAGLFLAALGLAGPHGSVPAHADATLDARLEQSRLYRQQGSVNLALDLLDETETSLRAGTLPESPDARARLAGERGIALTQAKRLEQAEYPLLLAYAHFRGHERARLAIDLGNLALARRQPDTALRYYREAATLGAKAPRVLATATLNAAGLLEAAQRQPILQRVAAQLDDPRTPIASGPEKARLHLNLGHQARALGAPALRLAYTQIVRARDIAQQAGDPRLALEATDALAQLYEDQQRDADARRINADGLAAIARSRQHNDHAAVSGDLAVSLHWREGRIARRGGDRAQALTSYQAAADELERIRPDIPIETLEHGETRSSFRATIEPIYLGLADLLLEQSSNTPSANMTPLLREARSVVELIKQSEMQDYLGDRCTVTTADSAQDQALPEGIAVLYPIIFPDRLELLLETAAGMSRHRVEVSGARLRTVAAEYARRLRNPAGGALPEARQLHDWLLGPIESSLAGMHSLVVVPDGIIRTLPIGALRDAQGRYVIEKIAVATAPGLSMTRRAAQRPPASASLIAGLSEPGAVVGKIPERQLSGNVGSDVGLPPPTQPLPSPAQLDQRRNALRLPGVQREVAALSSQLQSPAMLDAAFTLEAFGQSMGSGEYDIVHIASHGVFGGSGAESYLLAHDDLLTMDRLQGLLRTDNLRRRPIRLLALSACETAEGDERAPLGIAGAALKANAETALGTLWPVDDDATTQLVQRFYQGLTQQRLSRAEALRQAQLATLRHESWKHPFYWAPFIVVGNWE